MNDSKYEAQQRFNDVSWREVHRRIIDVIEFSFYHYGARARPIPAA